jgi:hypothetical protein
MVVSLLEARKLVLLLAAALATALLLTLAPGASAAPTKAGVSIDPNAAFDTIGAQIHVNLHVVCEEGTGTVQVEVQQSPPENTAPTFGRGVDTVVCDGRQHETSVTVTRLGPGGFDTGRAEAQAFLSAPSGEDMDEKTINIEVV